jgi:DNA gyrase subunit B
MKEERTCKVLEGLTRSLKKYADASGMLDKLKFDISDDFREGLTAIISVKAEPQFEGQTKNETWK